MKLLSHEFYHKFCFFESLFVETFQFFDALTTHGSWMDRSPGRKKEGCFWLFHLIESITSTHPTKTTALERRRQETPGLRN